MFFRDDFILREFDLGGNALGRNLMPNETILLDWVQQLPDNLEGDFYLILRIVETNQSFSVSTTPIYTLTTKNNGLTQMLSEDPETGGQIENAERPDTSSDGQRVVYEATHTNGIQQIFMIDSRVGNTPVLISHDFTNRNAAANFHCLRPAISADGSHVVFYSKASNLIPGDTNGHEDVFLYSTYTGKITAAFTQEIGNEGSFYPDISGDGRWVVFQSDATNLLDNETTIGRQIFLWDTYENKISLVSNAIDGSGGGNGESRRPSVSDDGLRIVFESDASNLVTNDTNNLYRCILLQCYYGWH